MNHFGENLCIEVNLLKDSNFYHDTLFVIFISLNNYLLALKYLNSLFFSFCFNLHAVPHPNFSLKKIFEFTFFSKLFKRALLAIHIFGTVCPSWTSSHKETTSQSSFNVSNVMFLFALYFVPSVFSEKKSYWF